ncbi:bifunctional mannitol-1-phosphate dehydrogenase/phosphatase [Acinetobacter sp. SFA]|uniref:bifunctional mannitol-1-phosphate dehydrogenase/phosphatase n=1 Tax=Acinetobacter sp. SFA TaxID=1805633 RepID=UPI0007D062C6|nr:HAD family hydrolase [Acinetobacter sp. SFA]OAL76052.1 haloacid dehalogenase [Acinetobacter sp. SFA]
MLEFKNQIVHGAIFDMDGTMFDTERLRFQTLQQASRELIGVEFSESYLIQCLGLSARSAEQLAKERYGQDVPYAEIRQRADVLELEHVRHHGVPIKKGLLQVLERLRKAGLKMAVATSSRRAIAEEYLINANVYKFFDVLVCGDEIRQGKPHPEIFISAAEKINLSPAQCLMFEDSENGLRSAYDAGGMTVLFKDIKIPNESMLAQAQYYYETVEDFLGELNQFVPVLDMPELETAFPQTLNQLTVGIHGFGAIGGGYLAQVLSHWDGYTRPRKIIASTRNPLYQSSVNAFGTYCIRYGQNSFDQRIENMSVIDAHDLEQMQNMYIESSLVAVCVPEEALVSEAEVIAQGLYARYLAYEQQDQPLTVLIILNKIGAKQQVMQQILNSLRMITDEQTAQKIMDQHYFCDTVVNRMVCKLSDQKLYRQLRIKYNMFKQYQLDEDLSVVDLDDATALNTEQEHQAGLYIEDLRRNFQPSHILQSMDLILFNAETDMPIYVENNSPLLAKMRQMILVDDIANIQLIKNRLWNGVHAMMAWYASLRGHQTIGIAMSDHIVRKFMHQSLAQVKHGLCYQIPKHASDLERLTQSFSESCANAYQDPCARVGREPLRKLEHNERVMGSLATLLKYSLPFDAVLKGAVLGYVYALEQGECEQQELLMHLQIQLKHMALEPQLYEALYDEMSQFINQIIAGKLSLQKFMQLDLQQALS